MDTVGDLGPFDSTAILPFCYLGPLGPLNFSAICYSSAARGTWGLSALLLCPRLWPLGVPKRSQRGPKRSLRSLSLNHFMLCEGSSLLNLLSLISSPVHFIPLDSSSLNSISSRSSLLKSIPATSSSLNSISLRSYSLDSRPLASSPLNSIPLNHESTELHSAVKKSAKLDSAELKSAEFCSTGFEFVARDSVKIESAEPDPSEIVLAELNFVETELTGLAPPDI